MLGLEWLRSMAFKAFPTFLDKSKDVVPGKNPVNEGAICWVGAAGCLTPLHYDLSDGLLAQVLGSKRVWLWDSDDQPSMCLRGERHPGIDNWERQSYAEMHGSRAAAFPSAANAQRWVADLSPGDLLYIPSGWLHEVHSKTASFSLGWRVAIEGAGGKKVERTSGQTLERLAASVKSGNMSMEDSLMQAMKNPELMKMMQVRDGRPPSLWPCRPEPEPSL
jgi:hypothetical protein